MIIIPAIDIIDGTCVRLIKGDYERQTTYSDNPVDVASSFKDLGFTNLHLVDLDGARIKQFTHYALLEEIVTKTNLIVDVGGGIHSYETVKRVFDSGAHQITCGSMAVHNRQLVLELLDEFGSERLILGADAKDGKIAISGWSETVDVELIDFIASYAKEGIVNVISTDIALDGMLQGPSFSLYEKLQTQFPSLQFVASGGVTTMSDVTRLGEMGMYGAIVGKAIYEKKIDIDQLAQYHINQGAL
ncbi:MAG: 1-(5-phosphoribosyl)-5-[(5-phosphoribosylamino)methylideneamino]imidazole-4-carboxamide isomerase [Sphaerochaetaceae bacterium]|jgi:phosphoribosylformimino-5-aminoimidazole carboxamide ribotide isomerase